MSPGLPRADTQQEATAASASSNAAASASQERHAGAVSSSRKESIASLATRAWASESSTTPKVVDAPPHSGGGGLAANLFSLVLLARSRDKLEDLARELGAQHGTKVTIVPADLSEPGAAQAVFDSLTDAGVQIDLLVNNAGLLLEGRFGVIGLDEQLQLLQVNIVALTALSLSQTLSCLAVDRESDDDRAQSGIFAGSLVGWLSI